jgi:alkaline phosphatase
MRFSLKVVSYLFIFFLSSLSVSAQTKQVRNIIMLIPDGTSIDVLSLSRWYKYGICKEDACWLNIDPYICGLVKTHSSNAPIGDSAPTSSTYAAGHLSQTGFIATYPPVSPGRDLVTVNPERAYQPMYTILEAAKLSGKSTGLVVTCQFPHATPADFSAHTNERDRYFDIAKQMVYNRLNVVFGGGTKYLSPEVRSDKEDLVSVLKQKNYKYITTKPEFDSVSAGDSLVWGLFAPDALPNDLDTDKAKIPSLAQMTQKAIDVLSQNKNGFFLMVEGSKVDWSAHTNDPVGIATEFLAFDDAVKQALDFAKKDGNTAVVICPDHGNSGISIGGGRLNSGYDTMSVTNLIKPLRDCKLTADGIAEKIAPLTSDQDIISTFKEYTQMTISQPELDMIKKAKASTGLVRAVAKVITEHTYISFTTHGHTGEDVMLAAYHPSGYRPTGVVQNSDINKYFREISGNVNLDSLTDQYFCRDSVLLKNYVWNIQLKRDTANVPVDESIVIRKSAKSKIRAEVKAFTDYVTIFNGNKPVKKISLNSVAVLNFLVDPKDKTKYTMQRFYCSKDLEKILASELK